MCNQPSLSPDGSKLAVMRQDPNTGNLDIWSFDMATGKSTAITNDESPDRHRSGPLAAIYYASSRLDGNYWGIFRKAADGSRNEELLNRFTPGTGLVLTDVSSDSKYVTFSSGGVLFVVPLTGSDVLARKAIEYAP